MAFPNPKALWVDFYSENNLLSVFLGARKENLGCNRSLFGLSVVLRFQPQPTPNSRESWEIIPWQSSGWDLTLLPPRAGVQSLVGELRSHKPSGQNTHTHTHTHTHKIDTWVPAPESSRISAVRLSPCLVSFSLPLSRASDSAFSLSQPLCPPPMISSSLRVHAFYCLLQTL